MKTKALLTLFLGISLFAHSQHTRFALSTNLLNLAVSGPSASLSYQLTPKIALQLYGSSGNFDRYLPNSTYQFKTAILDAKFMLTQFFFIGPYVRYIGKKSSKGRIS